MKKFLVVLAVIVLAVAGWSFWYFTRLSSISITNVLPAQPLFYAQFFDTRKHWDEFEHSEFGIRFAKINFNPFIQNNPKLAVLAHTFKALQDESNTIQREYVSKFLGQEVAVVVYRNNPEETIMGAGDRTRALFDQDLPEILWISRVSADIKFKEILMRFAPYKNSPEFRLERIPYRGHIIYFWPVSDTGLSVAFTRIGDLVVASLGDQGVRKVIDTNENVRASLSKDESFRLVFKNHPSNAFISVYWNSAEALELVTNWIQVNEAPDAKVNETLKNFKGFTTGSASVSRDKGLKIRGTAYFDPAELSDDMKAYVEPCAGGNQSAAFMPKDVFVYQWLGCLNFDRYWQKIKAEVEKLEKEKSAADAVAPNAIEQMEINLGLKIDDVLPAIGREIGWFANAGTQALPLVGVNVPQFGFFLKITDQLKVQMAISTLLQKFPSPPTKEIVDGVEIYFLKTPFGGSVEPGFMFLGDYLIIGLNRDILKEAIYAGEDKKSALASNPAFQKTVKSDEDSPVGVLYLKLGDFLERYSGLVNMGYKWVVTRRQTQQTTELKDIDPELAGYEQTIKTLSEELGNQQKIFKTTEEEVWSMELKGQDVKTGKAQLDRLKTRMESLQQEINEAKTRQIEKAQISIPPPRIDQSAVTWRNVIEPLLDALKVVNTMGLTTSLGKDNFSTDILIQMDK